MARPAARARIDEAVMSLRDPLLCQAMAYVVDFAEASMSLRAKVEAIIEKDHESPHRDPEASAPKPAAREGDS